MKVCPSCGKNFGDDVRFCPEEGTLLIDMQSSSKLPEDLTGYRLFGDYVLKKKLGEGGMGAVYLGENTAIDQRIAIKVLHPESAGSDEIIQRFNREARAISRLTHPNTIRVFIFGKTSDPLIYLAMEYVDGKSLRDVIFKEKHLTELRAINIMRQTLHALAEAHDLGVVHRDLKPDNIMLTKFRGVDDFVKVLDFGIAKVQEKDGEEQRKLTQAGVVYGTPEYLSPEQAKGKNIDHRSDLYAMGIILYEMVTGQVPFNGNTPLAILTGHVYQKPAEPSSIRGDLSPGMQQIIMKALEKDANNRYQNAMEFLEDLEKLEAKLRGGKVQRTTFIDASEVGALFEATKEAHKAQSTVMVPTQPQAVLPPATPAPAAAAPAPTPSPALQDENRKLHAAVELQNGIIRRQKTVVGVLAGATVVMAILALVAAVAL